MKAKELIIGACVGLLIGVCIKGNAYQEEEFCDTPAVLREQIITPFEDTKWKNKRRINEIKEIPAYQRVHIRKNGERYNQEDIDG